MVLFFTSTTHDPPVIIYMGKDKEESELDRSISSPIAEHTSNEQSSSLDEDLIKYAWPQDVWFHVDKLSSAHVYLRMPSSMTWDSIDRKILVDCAQLVKANSIEGGWTSIGDTSQSNSVHLGNKKDNLTVIYTPADNLKVSHTSSFRELRREDILT